jgi:hypothetical protein
MHRSIYGVMSRGMMVERVEKEQTTAQIRLYECWILLLFYVYGEKEKNKIYSSSRVW